MYCFIHSQREAIGSCVECGHGVCLLCLNKIEGRIYCDSCARQATQLRKPKAELNPNLFLGSLIEGKNRYLAALLAITLGAFGAHKFYLGQFAWGFIYLIFFWTGIPALAGFFEGIWYLMLSDQGFQRRYGNGVLLSLNQTSQLTTSSPVHSTPMRSPSRLEQASSQVLKSDTDYERCILRYARERKGRITVAQLVTDTPISIEKAEHYLARLETRGYTRVEIHPETGVIYYLFPEFMPPGSRSPEFPFRDS